jgi:GDP-D-mannose 3',5'-epimerase
MFAANMGGVGYIDSVHADIVRDNSQINVNTIMASSVSGVGTVFFASSACVYPIHKQSTPISKGLKESDAYPAEPDTHYGWEKLFTEQLLQAYEKDYGLNIRIARLHNVYGPEGAYEGGREKSPAALCRKIAMADSGDEIEIWGDGKQTRTYCYIDDCCKGIYMLMRSQCTHPINIGSDQSVTIQQLASSIRMIAKKKVAFRFNTSKPQGVRGRKPDNSLIRKTLGWEPRTPLSQGLKKTYDWIFSQARPRDL